MDGVCARLGDVRRAATCAVAAVSLGVAGLALWQLSRLLYTVVQDSTLEAERLVETVTAAVEGRAPPEVPPGLELYDDIEETYLYGSTQELFYRRDPGPNGHTEWQYSWDAREWWPTDQLSPPGSPFLLDPPSIIFITRLHLTSLVRRIANGGSGGGGNGGGSGATAKQSSRIPPPVVLPAWAAAQLEQQLNDATSPSWVAAQLEQQQQQQQVGSATAASTDFQQASASERSSSPGWQEVGGRRRHRGSNSGLPTCNGVTISSSSNSNSRARRLEDAPDALCCPITGQLMLQPVTLPSGAVYDYPSLRRWLMLHGTDPTTLTPTGLSDVRPCLLARGLVERWLAGEDVLGSAAASGSSTGGGG